MLIDFFCKFAVNSIRIHHTSFIAIKFQPFDHIKRRRFIARVFQIAASFQAANSKCVSHLLRLRTVILSPSAILPAKLHYRAIFHSGGLTGVVFVSRGAIIKFRERRASPKPVRLLVVNCLSVDNAEVHSASASSSYHSYHSPPTHPPTGREPWFENRPKKCGSTGSMWHPSRHTPTAHSKVDPSTESYM